MLGYTRKNDLATRLIYKVGIWENPNEKIKWLLNLRRYYMYIATISLAIVCFILPPIGVYAYWGKQWLAVLENICINFIAIHFSVKMIVYFYWGEPLEELSFTMEEMNRGYHKVHNVLSKTEQDLFETIAWFIDVSVRVVVVGFIGCVMLYVIGSTVIAVYERKIYVTFWFPWDDTASPFFEVFLLYLGSTILVGMVNLLLTDMYFMTLLIHTYEHLKLLQFNLTNIKEMSEREVQYMADTKHPSRRNTMNVFYHVENIDGLGTNPQDESTDQTEKKTKKSSRRYLIEPHRYQREPWRRIEDMKYSIWENNEVNVVMERRLKESIRHHQDIISFVRDLESAQDFIVSSQIVGNFIPSGCMVLWLTLAATVGFKEIMMVALLVGFYIELIVLSLLANLITDESSRVREAVYASDWFGASEGFKRSMRIMMSMANQPLVIVSAKHIPLSMETFLSVFKLTYSNYMTMMACIRGDSNLRVREAHKMNN